ncbi:MAG TPA: hypothetical protein P5077_03770 [bacterium]|nr:hypothetical protein [bacterium]
MRSSFFTFLVALAGLMLFSVACSSEGTGVPDDDDSENDLSDESDLMDEYLPEEQPDLSDLFEPSDGEVLSDELMADNDDLIPDVDAPCLATFYGLYTITGGDERGTYTGTGEIRDDGGSLRFIRAIVYDDAGWHGYRAAQAVEGELFADYRSIGAEVRLDNGGFVATVDSVTRPVPGKRYKTISVMLLPVAGCGRYLVSGDPVPPDTGDGFDEEWLWDAAPKEEPLWRNERVETPANPEPSTAEKVTINETYASFHELPAVQPYTDRDEFKKMVHYMVTDPTDRAFLRENPDTVRVIQRPVNDWTLAEAEMRRSAFAYTLAEKADFFSDFVQEKMINELGMMSHWNEAAQRYDQDGDSMLWTGVYVATMAWKYLIDQTQGSLDRMIKSLDGTLQCVEIVPDVTTFARTLRLHVDDGDPEFHEGTGPFAGIDWKEGGNNDMFKGFIIGHYWAWYVLKDSADPRAAGLITRMKNNLKRLHDNCEIAKDLRMNQLATALLLYAMYKGTLSETIYKNESATIWSYVEEYINKGGLPTNEYGISDWSGNHLGVWEFFILREVYEAVGDGTRVGDMQAALYEKGDAMRPARQGLFQLIVGARGTPQMVSDIDSGIECLQEVPMERGLYAVDRLWSPDFCMSPIPELFWKNDWTSPTADRTQSLRAYPLYEKGASSYYWKDNIYKGLRGSAGTGGDTGLDFLVGYWFARRYNLITEND